MHKQKFQIEIETDVYGNSPWTEEEVKLSFANGSLIEEFTLLNVKEIK